MHILRDMAIFVIFATISKLLSRYRFTPSPPGDSCLPPTRVGIGPRGRWVSL